MFENESEKLNVNWQYFYGKKTIKRKMDIYKSENIVLIYELYK